MNVLLIDDHKLITVFLKNLLSQSLGMNVTEASNGQEGYECLKKIVYELIITDLEMPVMDGFELIQRARNEHPNIPIIVLTMYKDREHIKRLVQLGAHGYINKDSDINEIISAVKMCLEGRKYFSSQILNSVFFEDQKSEDPKKILSNRELEILQLIFNENTNQEIADELFISTRTVETHKRNIIEKTGTKNIVGLIKFAIEHGLIIK